MVFAVVPETPYVEGETAGPMRGFAIFLAVALGATGALVFVSQSMGGTVTPPSNVGANALFLDQNALHTQYDLLAFDTTKRAVADLTGSGIKDIIADDDNGHIYVIRGSDGALLSELSTFHPPGWGARDMNDVAVGDVYGDGRMDIVSVNSVGFLTVFQLNKTQSTPDKLVWDKMWEKNLDPRIYWGMAVEQRRPWYNWSPQYPGNDGAPYLADVDGSGRLTIFVENDNMPGFWAINPDGSVRWAIDWSDGAAGPWVDDVFGTGHPSAVFATDGGDIYIFDAASGNLQSQFHTANLTGSCRAESPGSISVWPAVASIDGGPQKEIIFGTRAANGTNAQAQDSTWLHAQHAKIYAENPDGTLRWCFTAPWMDPHVCMHPAIIQVNGQTEIIYMDWNTIGHFPGNFEAVNPPHLFALSPDGQLLWVENMSTPWSNTDVAVADVYGDGQQDLLVVDNEGGQDGIAVIDPATGHHLGFIPGHAGWSVTRGPEVADLTGNGTLDVIVPMHTHASDCSIQVNTGCRPGALWIFPIAGKTTEFSGVVDLNAQYDALYGRAHASAPKPSQTLPTVSTGALEGTVSDSSGPVSGAKVTLTGEGHSYTATTAGDGTYVLRAPPGSYQASATDFGHTTVSRNVTIVAAQITWFSPVLPGGGPLAVLNPHSYGVPGPSAVEALGALAGAALLGLATRERARRRR
jgi:hypothetical protein